MSKSVIYFNEEKEWMQTDTIHSFCAPFTLSETDENKHTNELKGRMIKALATKGYEYELIQWHTRRVIYRKPKT